jgi:hypothetical protein
MADVPDELKARQRPLDPNFAPTEDLYMRFQHESGQQVEPANIRCPDQSVNRQKYCSRWEWVLTPQYAEAGVASFKVQDIPPVLVGGDGISVYFGVIHAPVEDNYSHSEIAAYSDELLQQRRSRTSRKVEQRFRVLLCQRMLILRHPAIAQQ